MKIVPTRAFMDCQHRTEKKLFFCPQIRVLDLTKKGEEKKKHNNPTLQYGLKNGQFFFNTWHLYSKNWKVFGLPL